MKRTDVNLPMPMFDWLDELAPEEGQGEYPSKSEVVRDGLRRLRRRMIDPAVDREDLPSGAMFTAQTEWSNTTTRLNFRYPVMFEDWIDRQGHYESRSHVARAGLRLLRDALEDDDRPVWRRQ